MKKTTFPIRNYDTRHEKPGQSRVAPKTPTPNTSTQKPTS